MLHSTWITFILWNCKISISPCFCKIDTQYWLLINHTERIRQRAHQYTTLNVSSDLCRIFFSASGILFYYKNLFVGFQFKFRNDWLHIETGKWKPSNCYLQMINVTRSLIPFCIRYRRIVGSTEQTALSVCSQVGISPTFAQVVVIIESAEQTAMAVCSLVRVSAVDASCDSGGNKNSAESNLPS